MNREQFLQEFSNLIDRENLQEVYEWFEDKSSVYRSELIGKIEEMKYDVEPLGDDLIDKNPMMIVGVERCKAVNQAIDDIIHLIKEGKE